MPTIRWTYFKDVRAHGDAPVEVPEVTARQAVADRRAVFVADDPVPGPPFIQVPPPSATGPDGEPIP